MSQIVQKSGVVITGQVSEVRSYISKKTGEEKYSVRLFIPGSDIIQVGLSGAPDPKRFIPGELVQMRISVGLYKGYIFFNEAV